MRFLQGVNRQHVKQGALLVAMVGAAVYQALDQMDNPVKAITTARSKRG